MYGHLRYVGIHPKPILHPSRMSRRAVNWGCAKIAGGFITTGANHVWVINRFPHSVSGSVSWANFTCAYISFWCVVLTSTKMKEVSEYTNCWFYICPLIWCRRRTRTRGVTTLTINRRYRDYRNRHCPHCRLCTCPCNPSLHWALSSQSAVHWLLKWCLCTQTRWSHPSLPRHHHDNINVLLPTLQRKHAINGLRGHGTILMYMYHFSLSGFQL